MYLTEHLLAGRTGNLLVMLALISALISAFSYFVGSDPLKASSAKWLRRGRWMYLISFLSLLAAGAILYFMIFNRYYEYQYVWKYSSNDMSLGYVISCFWAGQEGSFVIWALLQAIIGIIAMRYARHHEAGVMMVVALAQFFLLSMIWGIEFLGLKIGNSPFVLLRELPDNVGLEFFQDPDYLRLIRDGNGLNPLLENVWMIIHPPVLFLGYAASLIPFAYAISSLRQREYREWLKPVLPWILFSVVCLGAGILMGGAWAYVDLTFGGFWAWDPVENASLVPWMILVAALHIVLITKSRNHSYAWAYLLSILGFVLVVYASFLTRSGLLGDTSAHSFADDGLAIQMVFFLALFTLVPMILFFINLRKFPRKSEDDSSSREFWMFIGSVIIFLSAFQIIATTSLPVINKIIGTSFAPPVNRNAFYNNWQLPFAVLIAFLAGFSLYITYGKNSIKVFVRFFAITFTGSLVGTLLVVWLRQLYSVGLIVLVFASIFAMISSAYYLVRSLTKFKNYGAAISHLGLGIFLAGLVFAFGQSSVISKNTGGFQSGQGEMSVENQILFRDDIQKLGNYHVVYAGVRAEGKKMIYQLDFLKKGKDDLFYLDFSMHPEVVLNSKMGNVYMPATRNFWRKDLFIHITFADVFSGMSKDDYVLMNQTDIKQGDTLKLPGYMLSLDTLLVDYQGDEEGVNNLKILAPITAFTSNEIMLRDTLVYEINNGLVERNELVNPKSGHKYVFSGVSDSPQTISMQILEASMDFIVVKAREFPLIWLVWLGSISMLAGAIIALFRRLAYGRKNTEENG